MVAKIRLTAQTTAQEAAGMADDGGATTLSSQSDLRRPATDSLQKALFLALFSYLSWFALITGGILAYEGEPILVKSRDLPLHHFDVLFRSAGSALLFELWAVRAGAAHLAPAYFDRRANLVWMPVAIYAAQAFIRVAIYQLHVAGYIFTPQRFARDDVSHPPHVMSDHILLASAVHGGLASEALLPLLNAWHVDATGRGRTFMRAYSAVAAALAGLVSAECYFTARYFHPPHEIVLASMLGLAIFQAPLMLYAVRAFQARLAQLEQQAAELPATVAAPAPSDVVTEPAPVRQRISARLGRY